MPFGTMNAGSHRWHPCPRERPWTSRQGGCRSELCAEWGEAFAELRLQEPSSPCFLRRHYACPSPCMGRWRAFLIPVGQRLRSGGPASCTQAPHPPEQQRGQRGVLRRWKCGQRWAVRTGSPGNRQPCCPMPHRPTACGAGVPGARLATPSGVQMLRTAMFGMRLGLCSRAASASR